jgi:cation transport ATPase
MKDNGKCPRASSLPAVASPVTPASMRETYIAVVAAAGIAVHLVMRFVPHAFAAEQNWPLYVVLACGVALLWGLVRNILAGDFGSDLLAGLSITTSVFLGEYLAGSVVVLMLSGGGALEHYATRRASAVLNALSKRMRDWAAPHIVRRTISESIADRRSRPLRSARRCRWGT